MNTIDGKNAEQNKQISAMKHWLNRKSVMSLTTQGLSPPQAKEEPTSSLLR
jgi:hypothetical protein